LKNVYLAPRATPKTKKAAAKPDKTYQTGMDENMSTLERQLEEILAQNPETLVNNEILSLRKKISQHGEKFILFGTGHLGKLTLARLRKVGIEPIAFADNNSNIWNTTVDGLLVLSPQDAISKYAQSAIFVITVYTSGPVWDQLHSLGISAISFAELAWMYPALTPHGSVEHPYKIFEQAQDVKKAFALWADEDSQHEYIGQLQWRTSLDRSTLPHHLPQKEIYFVDDLVSRNNEEVFIDCGAFDGDSVQEFLNRHGSAFKKIIAIEPDPANGKAFIARIAKLPAEFQNRIQIIPNATSAVRSTVTFNATGTAGSAIGAGSYHVESIPLNELLARENPTFIKMDIEGTEPDTLLGASQIIASRAPVLAICLYHAQEHLWQIPLLIQSLNKDYNFFLRRYADECWEIVCYAVPKNRILV
jgi:FkbM family methyltransferase